MKTKDVTIRYQKTATVHSDRNQLAWLGKIAVGTCFLMYVSYIQQIMANLAGHPVAAIQPSVAMVNATLWFSYGWFKPHKDWPIIISNVPGIIFGLVTLITIYYH